MSRAMCPTCPFRGQWRVHGSRGESYAVPVEQARHLLDGCFVKVEGGTGTWEPGQCHDHPEDPCVGYAADVARCAISPSTTPFIGSSPALTTAANPAILP